MFASCSTLPSVGFLTATLLLLTSFASADEISLGFLSNVANHDLGGEVVALSERVLEFRNFTFDGRGPDVFFWADASATPSSNGFVLQDGMPVSSCGTANLQTAADGSETWRVEFPAGTSVLDVSEGSIGVWCGDFAVNFGDVKLAGIDLTGLKAVEEGPVLECDDVEVEYTESGSAALKGMLASVLVATTAAFAF